MKTRRSLNWEVCWVAAGCSFSYMHSMSSASQRESGAKCFSYATAQQTQLSSVVRHEKPRRGALRALIKIQLGARMDLKSKPGSDWKPSNKVKPASLLSALTERFFLLQPWSFISVDLLSTKTALIIFAKSNLY